MDTSHQRANKALCSVSALSYVPPREGQPKEHNYYSKEYKAPTLTTYDRLFHQPPGYDQKLHRDDRMHWRGRGLNINQEEKARVLPLLSSSEYGFHSATHLYNLKRKFARVACIQSEFYRKNGIIWNVEEGYGSVAPS